MTFLIPDNIEVERGDWIDKIGVLPLQSPSELLLTQKMQTTSIHLNKDERLLCVCQIKNENGLAPRLSLTPLPKAPVG